MKCGARVALGVAGGYFLGRTKKMKLALMLAGMAAGRRAGGPGELLAQGQKLLSSSPEFAKLQDEIRGRLIDAGKQAAVAVAARQVEALTDRVTQRAASLGDVAAGGRKPEEEVSGETDEAPEQEPEPEPASDADSQEPGPEPDRDSDGGNDETDAASSAPTRRRPAAAGARGRASGAGGTARRAASPATRAAGKATGRATRATRTRRSDDG